MIRFLTLLSLVFLTGCIYDVSPAPPPGVPTKAELEKVQYDKRPLCTIAGDSIAFGTGRWPGDEGHMSVKPHLSMCELNAKIGIPASAIVTRVKDAKEVVISAGSNPEDRGQYRNPEERLRAELLQIRGQITGHVRWIVPIPDMPRRQVLQIAKERGDAISEFQTGRMRGCARCDNLHPFTYTGLVNDVLGDLKTIQ